jgi:serine/threonine protein kinase
MQDELDIETTATQGSTPRLPAAPAQPPSLPQRPTAKPPMDIEVTASRPGVQQPPPARPKYFYTRGEEQCGPVSSSELKALAAAGSLLPTDQIWKDGMPEWVPASSAKGLFPSSAPMSTPRPPVRRVSSNAPGDNLDIETTVARPVPRPANVPISSTSFSVQKFQIPSDGQTVFPIGYVLDGKFVITKALGKGGIGMVYRATERDTGVEFAVKVLAPDLLNDPEARGDLKREVSNAQRLTHQNLLKVNYLADTGPTTYIVMECIDGENLEEYRVRKGGKITADDFRKIAPQVLGGLDYLHDKGVVHCDVKPQNIMITPSGEVKLTDYGIARTIKEQLSREPSTQISAGTLAYMAPEQLQDNGVCDRRADIYSAAMMFLRLTSEQFPFDMKTREAVVKWHLDEQHRVPSSGIASLDAVLPKALAVDPRNRYSNCRDFLNELRLGSSSTGQTAMPRDATAASRMSNAMQQLAALRACNGQLSFSAWYKIKFPWLFAMTGFAFFGVTYLMWAMYGFIWIPLWYFAGKSGHKILLDNEIAKLDREIQYLSSNG